MELSDGVITKEYQASHWLYTELQAKKGTVGQRAPTPSPSELPLTSVLRKDHNKSSQQASEPAQLQPILHSSTTSVTKIDAPPPQKPIPTEPRAHRLRGIQGTQSEVFTLPGLIHMESMWNPWNECWLGPQPIHCSMDIMDSIWNGHGMVMEWSWNGQFYMEFRHIHEVLAVPPLFLQESGHSGGIPVDSGGMKFSRRLC